MIGANVSVDMTNDVAGDVQRGIRRGMRTAADAGFAISQERVPADRGTLLQSGQPPAWVGDTVVWGYAAEYAPYVEQGTEPHWPPIAPLKGWARRVLGDESAAYAVQQKIAEEGTDAQPYVQPGIDEMIRQLRSQGLTAYIEEELE